MRERDKGFGAAAKVAAEILGIGIIVGAALVVSMDQVMKKLFVSDSWPQEEWSNDDWAEEELE